MDTVSVINDGLRQAIDLPAKYKINEREMYINRIGQILMLLPKNDPWSEIFKGLDMFTDDFMEDGRGEYEYIDSRTC